MFITKVESESSDFKISRSTEMSCLSLIQITCLLIVISSIQATPKLKSIETIRNDVFNKTLVKTKNYEKQLEDKINVNINYDIEGNQLKKEELPILPPIIILDFVNKVNKSSDLSDEKLKRTINEKLGYGFNLNNIFSEKHNFYFPVGKTESTVSIEESVSPFETKTVTEIIKPINEQTDLNITQTKVKNDLATDEELPNPLPLQINRESLPNYPPISPYGQRTKLQKTSTDFTNYMRRPIMPHLTTPSSNNYNKFIPNYESTKPASYQFTSSDASSFRNVNRYARPMTSHYLTNYMPDIYNRNNKNSYDNSKTTQNNNFYSNKEYNLANYPKYTIENGIKYEHKIIWKYPDGKISDSPPMSYVNSYSEQENQQKPNIPSMDNTYLSNTYQFNQTTYNQQHNTQGIRHNPYTDNSQYNTYSQKPIQYSIREEQSTEDHEQEQSKFVPPITADLSSRTHHNSENAYNPDNYQGQYGLRQHFKHNSHKVPSNHKNQDDSYNNYQSISKYIVNSSNPEYNYQIKNGQENSFLANEEINKEVPNKYSSDVQNYLMKLFSSGQTAVKNEDQIDDSENYAKTDYSHLFNYNPSISQYIKNPSSILNAQPTFVQIGNSVIPVIILRVDDQLPLQHKSGTNLNLKALLRQYLTQYATSISKEFQNTNYNFRDSVPHEEIPTSQSNLIEDLKHLTENLESLRQRENQRPNVVESNTSNYLQKKQMIHQENRQIPLKYNMNYSQLIRDYHKIYAAQQMRKSQDKVKSVQIIENPRYI